MAYPQLMLARRRTVERKVISVLRGEPLRQHCAADAGSSAQADHLARIFLRLGEQKFGALREHARRDGLVLFPADSPFMSEGELLLLVRLAKAQRMAGLDGADHIASAFRDVLADCARILGMLGLRLPHATLHMMVERRAAPIGSPTARGATGSGGGRMNGQGGRRGEPGLASPETKASDEAAYCRG